MKLVLKRRRDDGKVELRSPGVGHWRERPTRGSLVQAGYSVGRLEVLGQIHELEAPSGALGVVVEIGGDADDKHRAVGYDDLLVVLDPAMGVGAVVVPEETPETVGGLWFVAPTAGRFYGRPAPDKPPFVSVGDVLSDGDPIAVLEVMKTFTRLRYGGEALPPKAKVVEVLPADGDDIARGDHLFRLEAVD